MNPPMQTGDEWGTGSPGIGCYACSDRPDRCIAGHCRDACATTGRVCSRVVQEATTPVDQSWQACISVTTPPDDKVAACGTVIDAKRETGSKLAAAYCFRGHGLTESGSTMRRLPNSQGIPTARGCAWFAVQVRNVLKRA